MKKVIEGRRYDSDTAHKICEIWESGPGDFRHLDCALYQGKRSKSFFLAGFGGAMTLFSHKTSDGSYTGNTDIIPLSVKQARQYCERYANDQVEKFFEIEEA